MMLFVGIVSNLRQMCQLRQFGLTLFVGIVSTVCLFEMTLCTYLIIFQKIKIKRYSQQTP